MVIAMANRVIETNLIEEDIKIEGSLRPQTLDDYIGHFINKKDIPFLQIIENRRHFTRFLDSRPAGDFHVNTHFICDNAGQRGLTESKRLTGFLHRNNEETGSIKKGAWSLRWRTE